MRSMPDDAADASPTPDQAGGDVDAAQTPGVSQQHADELRSTQAKVPRWPLMAGGALLAVGLLVWLVPRQSSLATLHAQAQAPQVALEAAARGDTSSTSRIALAREHMRRGDNVAALLAVQDALDQNPQDVAALQTLADVYDRANRPNDALNTLERLQQLDPSSERQRLLVSRYHGSGQQSQWVQALTILIDRFQAGTVAEHLALAEHGRKTGAYQSAIDALDALERSQPQALTAEVVAAQVTTLLAMAKASNNKGAADRATEQALGRARTWLQAHPQRLNEDVVVVAAPWVQADQNDALAGLLAPLLESNAPSLVSTWTQAMKRAGRGDEALKRLTQWSAQAGVMGTELLHQRVALALELDRIEVAMHALRAQGLSRAPKAVVAAVAQAALAPIDGSGASGTNVRLPVLQELWKHGAQASLIAADSLLAARVAAAVGDHAAIGPLIDTASVGCAGKPDCAVQVAIINHQQGRGQEALAALKVADEASDLQETFLRDYARVSIALNRSREAAAKLEKQRRAPPSDHFSQAWLLLNTANGQHAAVTAWLGARQSSDVPTDVMREVFMMAVNAKAHALTVAAGQRLPAASLKPAEQVMVAQALMAQDRTAESLALWRQLRTQTQTYNDDYGLALSQAVGRGVGGAAEAEWVAWLVASLKTAAPGKRRDDMVLQLLQLGAHTQVLPTLELMALDDPVRWLQALETAATKANRPELLIPAWRKLVGQSTVPAALRQQVALQLFDAGDKVNADMAMRMLAVDKNPDDPLVQRLFEYWGARWEPNQLDWAEARALTVRPGPDAEAVRATWLKKLNDVGGAARTTAVYRRLATRPTRGPVFEAYVDALTKVGDRAALAAALRGTPSIN